MEKIALLIKGLITNIIFSALLFVCAGSMEYIQGWIFLAANVFATMMNLFFIQHNTALLKERSNPGEGAKSWDKKILGLSALVYLCIVVIAGLDSGRFLWTQHFDWVICISGVLLLICGQIIFLTARRQNSFFSSVVRIQKDRGHVVCDTGL